MLINVTPNVTNYVSNFFPSRRRLVTRETGSTSFNIALRPDTISDLAIEHVYLLNLARHSTTRPFIVGQKCRFEPLSDVKLFLTGSTGPSKFTASPKELI